MMTNPTPIIFSPRFHPSRLTPYVRSWLGLLAVGCLAALVLAAMMTPNPTGLGTHEWLGMRECQFLENTGMPCPSCGMTTSWAWFARGNVVASFYIQPMGFVLACGAALTAWIAGYCAITGRNPSPLLRLMPAKGILLSLLALAVAAWVWKIYIHSHGLDGWS